MPSGEFHRYWKDTHGPLVRSFAAALNARRYVQSHTLDHPLNGELVKGRGMSDPYDGITEVWWDSIDDLVAAMSTPQGAAGGQARLEGRVALHRSGPVDAAPHRGAHDLRVNRPAEKLPARPAILAAMPVYEYRCRTCDTTFETRRPMAESNAVATCPSGHLDTVRLLSVFASVGATAAGGSPDPTGGGAPCGAHCACHGG